MNKTVPTLILCALALGPMAACQDAANDTARSSEAAAPAAPPRAATFDFSVNYRDTENPERRGGFRGFADVDTQGDGLVVNMVGESLEGAGQGSARIEITMANYVGKPLNFTPDGDSGATFTLQPAGAGNPTSQWEGVVNVHYADDSGVKGFFRATHTQNENLQVRGFFDTTGQ